MYQTKSRKNNNNSTSNTLLKEGKRFHIWLIWLKSQSLMLLKLSSNLSLPPYFKKFSFFKIKYNIKILYHSKFQ